MQRVALRIAPYFVATTTIAVAIGIGTASLIQPGRNFDREALAVEIAATEHEPSVITQDRDRGPSFPEQVAALIPTSPLGAMLKRSMLQVVVFSILLGVALMCISPARAQPLLDLTTALQEVSMKVVSWAMLLAPYAVFGLLAQVTAQTGVDALISMSVYVAAVLLGLTALLCMYLLIVALLANRSPVGFLISVREAQLLAFSTSSSAAVMPVSIKTAQEKLGVRPEIAQFIVPLGATVNMDGTALYQVVAAVFLTQVFGIELGVVELVLLAATTVGASIGAPSTPGVGIVILATILEGIGVPASGIALILGVDRILDMARTTVNVSGDLVACC